MKPVLVIRHIACEGPGYLATALSRANVPWTLCAVDDHASIPDDPTQFSAIAAMGGPMSVNDDLPWIEQELTLLRAAHDRGLPLLGHCLGGQMLSKALGGQITRNPVKEIGWLPVSRTDDGAIPNWINGLPPTFDAFHWHGETFSIPPGATRLLGSERCANQALVAGNTLALQFHVEVTLDMIDAWAALYAEELRSPSPTVQSRATMLDRGMERIAQLQRVADIFYDGWIKRIERVS